ncbi:hypothetical protein ACB092_10G165100 [Castanea dentata]
MASGYGLAEIYVMKKLQKEKMKTREEEERANRDEIEFEEKKSSGCFFFAFKKIHPNNPPRIIDVPEKEVETWDYNKGR